MRKPFTYRHFVGLVLAASLLGACGGSSTDRDRNVNFDALTHSNCADAQIQHADAALVEAETLLANAVAYFEAGLHGKRYTTWFGAYEPTRWATVKDVYRRMYDAVHSAQIGTTCLPTDCSPGTFGYVYNSVKPFQVYVCDAFFSAGATGTDTRGGTLVHLFSEFTSLGNTQNYAYGSSSAKSLAVSNPGNATSNADNFEYFAENDPVIVEAVVTTSTTSTTSTVVATTLPLAVASTNSIPPATSKALPETTTVVPQTMAPNEVAAPAAVATQTTKAETATTQISIAPTSPVSTVSSTVASKTPIKTLLIRCVKGKTVKKIGGSHPRCPAGYKRK